MLPYAPDNDAALRYVRKEHPDFIVLDSDYAAERPYVTTWLASAIPDPHARVVYALARPGEPAIQIVKWAVVKEN